MTKNLLITIACFVGLSVVERRAEAVCQSYEYFDYYYYTYYSYTYDPATGVYGCTVQPPGHPNANKHILYIHGRASQGTPPEGTVPTASLPADWDTQVVAYDGDARLYGAPNTTIKNALKTYCRNGHSCAIVVYSGGNNRLLYAINELNAEGTPPSGMLWAESIASAGGGTGTARYTTKKVYRIIAKLMGHYADLDNDLLDTQWGAGGQYHNLQNLMPAATYHLGAGTKDICVKIGVLGWLFTGKTKLCGNSYLPGNAGDAIVPVYSACGYADSNVHSHCCEAGYKYANRTFDSYGSCSYQQDHIEVIKTGLKLVATTRIPNSIALTYAASSAALASGGSEPNCNPAFWDCDHNEAEGKAWFYIYQGFQNSVETDLRPFTCADCNVHGLGAATYTGEYWYSNYDDYYCQYYFECYSYAVYYWSVATTWGQTMTCYSYDSGGGYPSCS